jgi:hypothetical protein
MSDRTKDFLDALGRDLEPLQRAIAELDGLWGKGIGTNGAVDKRVLDELRGRKSGLRVQLGALERLAAGEVPE